MSIHGSGIGKPRTALGKLLDKNNLTQGWLERKTGINDQTMTKLCGRTNYTPHDATKKKVIRVLREELNIDIVEDDLW